MMTNFKSPLEVSALGQYRLTLLYLHNVYYIIFFRICRTDSEIFEDSVELQQFFIKIRDELCKNGEILLSSALNYTLKHLHSDVEQEKREKIPKEIEEDKQRTKEDEEFKGVCELLPKCTGYVKMLMC